MKKIVLLLVVTLFVAFNFSVLGQKNTSEFIPKLEKKRSFSSVETPSELKNSPFKNDEFLLDQSVSLSEVKKTQHRGSKTILDTLKLMDFKRTSGAPKNWLTNTNFYAPFTLKGYPASKPYTGTDYLSMYQKYISLTPVKIKGVGVVMKALNTTSSNVKVTFYGKKTKGGKVETLGEVTKSVGAGNPSLIYFNLVSDVFAVDTFIFQISPVTNGVDSIQVYTNGKYGNTTSATASIKDSVLTATSYKDIGFTVGQIISGNGVLADTKIIKQTGNGVFLINKKQTVTTTTITAKTFTYGYDGGTLGIYNVPTTGNPQKFQDYIYWNSTDNKAYETDVLSYPIVEYTWDSNPTIDNKCLGTNKTVKITGSSKDLITNPLFNINAFYQKYLGYTKADKNYYHYVSFANDKTADQIDHVTADYSVSKTYLNDVNDTVKIYEYLISYNAKTNVNSFTTQFLVSSSLVATSSSQNATGNNADGKAIVNVKGGFSPYTYSWTNSSATTNSINVTPGTYKPTIVDANQCSFVADEIVVSGTQAPKSSDKDFLTYSINGVPGVISGNTITLTLPSGTSLANLSAVYTTSPKSTVTTGANTTNFTNAVTYVVTAEDLTTKTYIVTVNVTQAVKSTSCDITSFSLGLTQGVISGNVITLTLPSGSSLTQVATFVLSNGAIAKIGGAAQQSGVTSIDFSTDKVYDITAEDGTTKKSYTVKVTVAQAPVIGCKDLDNWKDGKNTVEALYPIDSTGFSGNGYFTGTGNYYFQGLHEKFETINDGKNHKLSSVKYVFGNLVSGNDTNTVLFVGYLPDPTTKLPGTTSLFSKRVLVKTVVSSLNNKGEYVLDLSADNLKVNGPFYAGISIRYRGAWGTASVGQDTIAILSNTMGAQGSTLNSAYCNYRNSNKVMVYDTIMPDNARFSLGIYANVCDLSAAKDLLSFNFSNPVGTVSTSGNTITLTLPNGTSPSVLASLVANFTSSPKSTVTIGQVSQVSGQTVNDFSTSKVYTVTAEDGSTKNYTITVTIQQSQKSTEKDFLTYSINGVPGVISGNTITLTLPSGTSLANLSAVYTTSPKSTVTTGANTTNFTNPVTYVVTAEDGSTKTYIVTVTINSTNPNSLADLISFGFSNPNVTGVISGKNVTLTVPTGTYVKSLVASFVVSPGATVKVSNITQISNGSVIDYSAPVTFVITSQDGKTINSYVVNVNLTPLLSPEKELLSFSFPSLSLSGTITGNTVGVTVPFGTNVSALAATFTTSPNSTVRIGSTVQVSGSSVNNFVNSILYTIVAQDGSIKNYTVVVTISAQTGGGNGAGTITSFALGSPLIPGTISGTTITIEGQAGSDITKQLIVFGIPKGSTLTLNGVVQTSGVSIVDFSNNQTFTLVGADGSKKDYIVKVTIPKKSGNSFTTFGFLETPTAVTTIDTTNKLITVHVPYNAPITKLTSYYLVSPGAVVTYGGQQLLSASTYLSFVNDQTFVVVAENNKTAAYKIHVIVDAQTSGIEEVSISSVDIYPNPSNGEFTCRASFDSYELKVLDVLGNEVYFSRIESNGTDKHVFDISEFGSGIYFASIHMNGISTIIKLEVVK